MYQKKPRQWRALTQGSGGKHMCTNVQLISHHKTIDRAFRIALGDLAGNIQPWQGGPDAVSHPCILAGLDYDQPWTRDAAFNSWYAGSLLIPAVARNTLLAVLVRDQAGLRIGGEYWDAVVWVTAAWNHYLATRDRDFLATALEAAQNSLKYFEATEQDPSDGLFRGGACFQDGVSGYPPYFSDGPTSGIADWIKAHPREKSARGYGLPMKALSTNVLYFNAYRLLPAMATALGLPEVPQWKKRADQLKQAIQKHFWSAEAGHYRYLVDGHDNTDRQEGFGHAFVLLFGIADPEQARSILQRQHTTPHGVPCVWPPYERYTRPDGTAFGRHSGPIWPQVNTAWAMAAKACGRRDLAWQELEALATKACRDNQFAEIYHPVTGAIYGGLQEWWDGSGVKEWTSCQRQTWCATGYVQMILSTLAGLELEPGGARFSPWLPVDIKQLSLSGLHYGRCTIDLVVERGTGADTQAELNGTSVADAFVDKDATGQQQLIVRLGSRSSGSGL